MSPRKAVNHQDITNFLQTLAARFSGKGRVYLVGGSSIVYEKLRNVTIDIDITFEIEPQRHCEFIEVIRELKDLLNINIEEVSPEHFIPLPSGYRDRSIFVGRFGSLDVFHFDFYSGALSKIERGTEVDFQDVILLLKSGKIKFNELEAYFNEILQVYGLKSLKQDPKEFIRKFGALKKLLAEANQSNSTA